MCSRVGVQTGGLVAKSDGVLHVHGCCAADMLPGVVKALSTFGQALVGFYGGGNGRLEVEGVAQLVGAPLVRISQTVQDALGVSSKHAMSFKEPKPQLGRAA